MRITKVEFQIFDQGVKITNESDFVMEICEKTTGKKRKYVTRFVINPEKFLIIEDLDIMQFYFTFIKKEKHE